MNTPTPPAINPWHRRWRRWLAFGVLRVVLLAGVGGALVGGAAWLGGSESGLRWLGAMLTQASSGRLQIDGARGRLLGDWRVQSLRWRDETLAAEVGQLTVSWSPAALLSGQLVFAHLDAASVHLSLPASPQAATPPDDLQLPFAVRIDRLRIGALRYDEDGRGGGPLLATAISARLVSDGVQHRLEAVQAQIGRLALTGDATLAARAPFAIDGKAALIASADGHRFALDLTAGGTLERVRVDGRAGTASELSGELQATLAPFAEQPLASLRAALRDIDPALLFTGAPHARLDVDLALAAGPQGAQPLSGRLQVRNRAAGRIDRDSLPLQSLSGGVGWRGSALDFDPLVVELAAGGRLDGRARLAGARLDLELSARRVDARALHGALPPTRLGGPLRACLGLRQQSVDVDWRDARYALAVRASADAQAIEFARLQLAAGAARLEAQGRLALTGERRFTAQGRLRDFDPGRFVSSAVSDLPRARISATFAARGAWAPTVALALRFDLADSRLGGQELSGRGELDWSKGRLHSADVDLQAAGNRLRVRGALGRPGDALHLALAAPRLAALGWAPLTGEANASIDIAGSPASPEFSGELQATRLHVASWAELGELSFKAQLAAGAQGRLAATLRCVACALPAYAVAPVTLDVSVDGVRQQHRLSAQVGLPGRRELHFVLDGGLATEPSRTGMPPALSWRGSLAALRLTPGIAAGAPLLELGAPAPLQFGAAALSFGPATLTGRLGRLTVDRLGFAQGRWQSAGRLQQWRPQDALAEFTSLQAWREALGTVSEQPLVLAGDWDLQFASVLTGRAALWRERGDLALAELPLGLGEARVQATFGDGRLAAKAIVRGNRLGEVDADFSVGADGAAQPISRQSPWQGRLQAHVPDIAWLAALLGEGWQVGGALQGELRLVGSAERPVFSGQWRGERLALRALDQGMRLERGEAQLEIDTQRLRLKRLRFESDLQALPRVLRLDPQIDAARLVGTPGVLEASGELALAGAQNGEARLNVRLDRVGVVQRSDQWVAVSGDGELRFAEHSLAVDGKLRADAAFWALAPLGRPALADDVVRHGARMPRAGGGGVARAFKLDLALALGRSAYFRGAGVDTRLSGELRVRSDDAGLPRATGSISAVDGRFDAYGQKLDIERGIVNFQGPIDNPGLNLLAVRRNQQVEAGVEVSGTALRPQIRLVSTPTVPDAEKLSWLVLGHSPEQQGGGDSAVLFAAAQTLFGGQDGGVLRQLQRGLGIDEFGVSSGQLGGLGTLPTSRVASSSGFGASSQTVNGQIVSVGKRLTTNAVLSYQQSLNTTESLVKLTVNLGRQFSVVGSAGSDSALDFFWNHSFGR